MLLPHPPFGRVCERVVIFHSSPTIFGSARTRDDFPMPRAPWMLRIGVCPSRPSRRKLAALRKDSVIQAGSRPRSNINGAFFRP